jgi:hypothetical protein
MDAKRLSRVLQIVCADGNEKKDSVVADGGITLLQTASGIFHPCIHEPKIDGKHGSKLHLLLKDSNSEMWHDVVYSWLTSPSFSPKQQ